MRLLIIQDDVIQKARVSDDQGFTVTAALADQAAVDLSKVWPAPCTVLDSTCKAVLICGSPLEGVPRGASLRLGPAHDHHMSVPVQVDVEEIEDGSIAEPDPGVSDKAQAAAEAVAVAEQPERELHSFEIDPAQVKACAQPASEFSILRATPAFNAHSLEAKYRMVQLRYAAPCAKQSDFLEWGWTQWACISECNTIPGLLRWSM